MTDLRQAAQQALEAWDDPMKDLRDLCVAMDAIRTALEQTEPVGEVIDERGEVDYISYVPPVGTALYTTPPQRKPLSDEQADQIISGLQTCHHQSSKREFLKVWLRDWAAHGIKEGT